MARHRRIQKKKRNKLKSVDPFNHKARGEAEKAAKAFNRPPKPDELDCQQFSRSAREIAVLKQQAAIPSAEKRKRNRQRNRIEEETKKAGFKQRPFEGEFQFMDRIKRETHAKVQEQLLKVRFNMGGRDPRAIDNELKEMDLQEAEKKKRKAANRAAALETSKAKKTKKKAVTSSEMNDDSEDPVEAESSQSVNSKEAVDTIGAEDASKKSGKIDRKKRIRMLKAEENKSEQKELLLNAREVIPFGERADAPPEFDGLNRKALKAGFTKAGSKQLLLKAMLTPPATPSEQDLPQQSTAQKELSDERDRVIAAYRTFKKIRRQHAQALSAAEKDVDDDDSS